MSNTAEVQHGVRKQVREENSLYLYEAQTM